MTRLSDLFDIEYGNQTDLNKLEETTPDQGVRFISRSSENLGFKCYVKPKRNMKLYKKGDITVTLGGTYLLSAFVQPSNFYTAQNIKVLTPKKKMGDIEKYFYCYVIAQNRFRYTSHGREANKTIDNLPVHSLDELPNWIDRVTSKIKRPSKTAISNSHLSLDTLSWKVLRFKDIFIIRKGYYNSKPPSKKGGKVPFIGATAENNGITSYHDIETIKQYTKSNNYKNHSLSSKIFKGGEFITVSNNGSVGFSFYQPVDFTCSHDVNPISIKDKKMNSYIAMFLCTAIGLEKYRWAYGRKWRPSRMPESTIKLPIDKNGEPDWKFMEDYIKSLPYSKNLEDIK